MGWGLMPIFTRVAWADQQGPHMQRHLQQTWQATPPPPPPPPRMWGPTHTPPHNQGHNDRHTTVHGKFQKPREHIQQACCIPDCRLIPPIMCHTIQCHTHCAHASTWVGPSGMPQGRLKACSQSDYVGAHTTAAAMQLLEVPRLHRQGVAAPGLRH